MPAVARSKASIFLSTGAAPTSVAHSAELGASAGYVFNPSWSLQIDAQNLLDEEYLQYFGDKEHLANGYKNGRRLHGEPACEFLSASKELLRPQSEGAPGAWCSVWHVPLVYCDSERSVRTHLTTAGYVLLDASSGGTRCPLRQMRSVGTASC